MRSAHQARQRAARRFLTRPAAGAALALSLVAGSLLAAEASPPRGRWHIVFDGAPPLAYSVLFSRTPAGDETVLLVEARAGRFELVSRQPADRSETFESVTDVTARGTRESLSRRLVYGAVPGVAACVRVAVPDGCVVLEGRRGRLEARLSSFGGEGGAALSARARALVTPAFLARLTGLAEVFPLSTEFDLYADDFLALLDATTFRPKKERRLGTRVPGCDFQATFGHPCDASERRRDEVLGRRKR